MKNTILYLALGMGVGLGTLSGQALADKSPALKRAEQAASQVDISDALQRDTDSMSRSIYLGSKPASHDFDVTQGGEYIIEARAFHGTSGLYEVNAELRDDSGQTLATASGNNQTNGLMIRHQLEPGTYHVVITGQSRSPARDQTRSVTVSVQRSDADMRGEGLADANRIERLGSASAAAASNNADTPARLGREGAVQGDATLAGVGTSQRSASKTAAPDDTVSQPGPSGQALEQAAQSTTADQAEGMTAGQGDIRTAPRSERDDTARSAQSAQGQGTENASPIRERILRDVPIRTDGEVLKFEVVSAGTVTVDSFTMDSSGNYRISGELVDSNGNVVASDSGSGFQGDFHLRESLEPGIYSVRVRGQKFGGVRGGANSFTLRIEQPGD
ncbi:hypothetical protein SAMN05421848_1246 [Kushneria avicenniae]|uniref:Pre-peptidase C-terminal domain-containing protein n=1 Tax=Kushneria avicenniae TaxID=402385 RepID=A0A1I1IHS4_9GAMM|nr:hypothetical protein [Kushneria avicenniae]SFC35797.1 hypothetical protein SAMN05421848_1246 [Kushneria avicenniae]